ncbi:peptidase domain-containing ABC transporter [Streptomyces sp. NPDC088194]|uniref:peptidase domain-containing ABC transporter n=1 Tax=Streptomyces sp. NPDC088194 TaxID=3154931 RepID=UPI00344E9A8A
MSLPPFARRLLPARRVPLRVQLTRTECGAACLAMVLSFHGRQTSVPESRARLEMGRDGVSAGEIARAAETFGLRVTVDTSDDAWARPQSGPTIAYLSRHHFVVVAKVSRSHVWIADPGAGRRRLPRAEFAEGYGGVLLRFVPGPDFAHRRSAVRDLPMVRYLRQFVAMPGGRRRLALAALLAAGLQGLGLAAPMATRAIVDSVIPGHRVGSLGFFLVAAVGVAVLCGVLAAARGLAMLALRVRGDQRLSREFVTHLFALPLGFFGDRGRGDLLMRLASVSSTREALTQQLLTTVLDGCLLSGYVIGLLVTAPLFAVAVVPLFVLQLAVVTGSYRKTRILAQRELAAKTEEQGYLVEALEAISALKANGVERRATARWERLFTTYQTASAHRGRWTAWLTGAQKGLSMFGPLALLWLGAWLVLTHRMSVGTMLADNAIALSVLSPIETFANSGQMYQGIRAQVERVFDVLDAPRERSGTVRLPAAASSAISLSDVAFRYPGGRRPTLEDITFTVAAGRKTAIVGRTGSGKSTLGGLLLGLHLPERGEIRHDGVALADLDLPDLRAHCGAVLQDLTLFDGSIRDNLVLSRPDAGLDEIVRAARLAGLHDDVAALPMGYDTAVGEGGTGLSAGQRQRVALARALIHRPRLLLLDEATSHLDPETERRVDAALSELSITRVVISHRINAVRNADQIIALERGRIVQRGDHRRLIAQPGVYRDLFGHDEAAGADPGPHPDLAVPAGGAAPDLAVPAAGTALDLAAPAAGAAPDLAAPAADRRVEVTS